MTKRAILYARVSKDDSRNATSSLGAQLNLTREYAIEQGWKIIAEFAEDDRGAKGSDFDLPKLNEALELARTREFDVLVTRELDRFARGLAKQLVIEREFKQAGVHVEYVLGDYPETPEGNLNKLIRAVIAEFEAEKIKERMLRGRRNKVKAGHVMTHGPAPYGYKKVITKEGLVTLTIDEETARVVRMIFNWYVEGVSVNDIIRKLNAMNIPTPTDIRNMRGVKKKKRYGEWSKSTIHVFLKNETYVGRWHYGKKGNDTANPTDYWIEVEVPAIIEAEIWLAAVERRKRNKAMAKRNVQHDYLIRGMGICGHCGYKIQAVSYVYTSSVRKTRYFYYRCPVRSYPLIYSPEDCDLPTFRSNEVDAAVWKTVKTFLKDPAKLAKGVKHYHAERVKSKEPLLERVQVVKEMIKESQEHLDRLLDLYLSDDFPKEVLLDRKERLESTIKSLKTERVSLESQLEDSLSERDLGSLRDFAEKVAKGIEKAESDFARRRRILEMLGIQITFAFENEERILYIRCELGLDASLILNNSTRFAGRVPRGHPARAG